MDIDLTNLSDAALADLIFKAEAERQARRVITTVEQKVQQVVEKAEEKKISLAAEYIFARDRVSPDSDGSSPKEWIAPTGAHDAYPLGYPVLWKGKVWINTYAGNSWEPGTNNSQWIEKIDPNHTGIEWGVGQAITVGDERIYEGRIWKAKVAHVTHIGWAPSEFTHAVWENMGVYTPPSEEESEEPTDPEGPGEEPDPEPEPPAPTIPEWSAQATYKVGDKVTYGGKTYECLVAHGAEYQGTWKPGVAHSVWKDLGPVA